MAGRDSVAILELDMRFFAEGAKATSHEKIDAVLALFSTFCSEASDEAEGEDEVPPSMRRAIKRTEVPNDSDAPFLKV